MACIIIKEGGKINIFGQKNNFGLEGFLTGVEKSGEFGIFVRKFMPMPFFSKSGIWLVENIWQHCWIY